MCGHWVSSAPRTHPPGREERSPQFGATRRHAAYSCFQNTFSKPPFSHKVRHAQIFVQVLSDFAQGANAQNRSCAQGCATRECANQCCARVCANRHYVKMSETKRGRRKPGKYKPFSAAPMSTPAGGNTRLPGPINLDLALLDLPGFINLDLGLLDPENLAPANCRASEAMSKHAQVCCLGLRMGRRHVISLVDWTRGLQPFPRRSFRRSYSLLQEGNPSSGEDLVVVLLFLDMSQFGGLSTQHTHTHTAH